MTTSKLIAAAAAVFLTQQAAQHHLHPGLTEEQQEILSHMSIVYVPDGRCRVYRTRGADSVILAGNGPQTLVLAMLTSR